MRRILRVLMTSAFMASIAVSSVAGVASAAMSPNGNGTSFELYEEMCLDDITVILCFEVHGRFTVVDQNDGDQIGTGAIRNRSYVIQGGRVVSASIDHQVWQSKIVDGVFQNELTITHGRALTPGQQCITHAVLRIENGVVVVDQATTSCN